MHSNRYVYYTLYENVKHINSSIIFFLENLKIFILLKLSLPRHKKHMSNSPNENLILKLFHKMCTLINTKIGFT